LSDSEWVVLGDELLGDELVGDELLEQKKHSEFFFSLERKC